MHFPPAKTHRIHEHATPNTKDRPAFPGETGLCDIRWWDTHVSDNAAPAFPDPDDARFRGWERPYQYVREPLTADESDRPSNACETTTERLVVWTLLDTALRVGELCGLIPKSI